MGLTFGPPAQALWGFSEPHHTEALGLAWLMSPGTWAWGGMRFFLSWVPTRQTPGDQLPKREVQAL